MLKQFPELKNISLLQNEVFVLLEVNVPQGLIMDATYTGWAYVLLVGETCRENVKQLQPGDRIAYSKRVDLRPYFEDGAKKILNSNCVAHTFKTLESFSGEEQTALINEFDILAVDRGNTELPPMGKKVSSAKIIAQA